MKTATPALIAKIPILYEDDFLVIADKPAGLPTQATLDKNRAHTYGILQKQLREKNPEAYLAMHHRLDKDTSGVLLFCKDPRYNQQIGDMFKRHEFEKIYWALTGTGRCKDSWQVKNFLAEKPAPRSQRRKMQSVRSGGLPAITDFRKLECKKKASCLRPNHEQDACTRFASI